MPEPGSLFFWLIMLLVLIGSSVSASAGFGFSIVLVGVLHFFMQPVVNGILEHPDIVGITFVA